MLLVADVARAQDTEAIAVDYQVPGTCPSAEWFMAEVGARTPRARPASTGERARVLVVRIEGMDGGYVGRLSIDDAGTRSTPRELRGGTCSEVASALALPPWGKGKARASAGAGATAAKVGGASLLAKIIGGTLIVAAVGGGATVAVRQSSAPPAPVISTAAAPQVASVAPAASRANVPSAVVEETSTPLPVVEANALPSTPAATARPTPRASTTPQESSLTRELGSLDGARALLGRGDATGALAALDRHDREFANGSMRAESAMLRVEALLAKGDEAGAKARAKDLLAKDANGPHAKRLRTILDR